MFIFAQHTTWPTHRTSHKATALVNSVIAVKSSQLRILISPTPSVKTYSVLHLPGSARTHFQSRTHTNNGRVHSLTDLSLLRKKKKCPEHKHPLAIMTRAIPVNGKHTELRKPLNRTVTLTLDKEESAR